METIVLSSGDSDGESKPGSPPNRQSTTIRDPRLRPGTAYAERSIRSCPTGRRQPVGFGRAITPSPGSSARTPPRRAASNCAPDSDSEDEPTSTPARAGGVSLHFTDAAGRRIYPEPYQCHPSPAGSLKSSREYNPCGRHDDDRDHPTPYAEDARDDEEGRGEQAPYVEDASDNENEDAYSMSSRKYDDDPQEGAAHYVHTGEDRYGYHRGSWMYLIKTSWETILIEAPYRPPDRDLPAVPRTPVHHGTR